MVIAGLVDHREKNLWGKRECRTSPHLNRVLQLADNEAFYLSSRSTQERICHDCQPCLVNWGRESQRKRKREREGKQSTEREGLIPRGHRCTSSAALLRFGRAKDICFLQTWSHQQLGVMWSEEEVKPIHARLSPATVWDLLKRWVNLNW